jgi:hypothetical protein
MLITPLVHPTDRVVNAFTFEVVYVIYTPFGLGYPGTIPNLLVVGSTSYTLYQCSQSPECITDAILLVYYTLKVIDWPPLVSHFSFWYAPLFSVRIQGLPELTYLHLINLICH